MKKFKDSLMTIINTQLEFEVSALKETEKVGTLNYLKRITLISRDMIHAIFESFDNFVGDQLSALGMHLDGKRIPLYKMNDEKQNNS